MDLLFAVSDKKLKSVFNAVFMASFITVGSINSGADKSVTDVITGIES
mgnify:CR=1 FL=1